MAGRVATMEATAAAARASRSPPSKGQRQVVGASNNSGSFKSRGSTSSAEGEGEELPAGAVERWVSSPTTSILLSPATPSSGDKHRRRDADFFRARMPDAAGKLPTEAEFEEMELCETTEGEIPPGTLHLCRYKNVLPNPRTRVVLQPLAGLAGEELVLSRFVNANTVRGADGKPRYIATQGPKIHTVDHFWRLVWQQQTTLIVMATEIVELNRIKCHQYWPHGIGDDESMVTQPSGIKITMLRSREIGSNIIRTLQLESGGVTREVDHLQFIGWPVICLGFEHLTPAIQDLSSNI
jgi:hypothetical protein